MRRETKNLESCGGGAVSMCRDKYTNNWYLDKLKQNKDKDKYNK